MTLEDETDIANIIVWPKVFEKNRRTVMTARFLAVRGTPATRRPRHPCGRGKLYRSFRQLPWLRDGGDLFSPKFSGGRRMPDEAPCRCKSRDFH